MAFAQVGQAIAAPMLQPVVIRMPQEQILLTLVLSSQRHLEYVED